MNNLNYKNLINYSKDDLIKIILSLKENQPIPKPRTIKPVKSIPEPTPRRSVRDMVQDYEENIIQPPLEFRDRAVPMPRTIKPVKPTPAPRTIKPVKPTPAPRTQINQVDKALKGYTQSFDIGIKHSKDPLLQLQNTRKAVEYHLIKTLPSMKGIKFVETLKVTFSKMTGDGIIYKTAFFNSKAQTIINNEEIFGSLQLSKQQILNFVAVWISESSG